jgi:hypothetical protein
MNRHAEKLVYETARVEEVHTCPSCGGSGSRSAPDGQADMATLARR